MGICHGLSAELHSNQGCIAGWIREGGDGVEWKGGLDFECEEILWELSELNFHFELLALHSQATTAPDKDPQELVSACFPGCNSRSLLVADLGTANHGLAGGSWEDRAFYLHALKRLMMSLERRYTTDFACREVSMARAGHPQP
jgi:hypothetical protein